MVQGCLKNYQMVCMILCGLYMYIQELPNITGILVYIVQAIAMCIMYTCSYASCTSVSRG